MLMSENDIKTEILHLTNYLQLNNIPSLVVAVIINISPVTTFTCY